MSISETELKTVGKSGQISLGKKYAGKTLREHYGLNWPETVFKDGVTYERPKSSVAMGGV
jgi:hypothetical protein